MSEGENGQGGLLSAGRAPDDRRALAERGEAAAPAALLRGTTHVATLFTADGTIIWMSPSTQRILGHPPHALVGTNVLDHMHPDDLETVGIFLGRFASEPTDGSLERADADAALDVRMRHADGGWVAFDVVINNLLETEGIGAVLAVGRQVTARRAMDDALAALGQDPTGDHALELLVAFIEVRFPNLAAALFAPEEDPEWTVGQVPEGLIGGAGPWSTALRSDRNVVVADVSGADVDVLPAVLADRAVAAGYGACWCFTIPVRSELLLTTKRGSGPEDRAFAVLVVWARGAGAPLLGEQAILEWAAGLANLALGRRRAARAHESRLDAERELNERLVRVDAVRNELFRNVAHELRTPLTAVVSFAELLRSGLDTDTRADQEHFLEVIDRSAQRMLRLIGDLSLLGSLESGAIEVAPADVDIPDLMARVVAALRPDATRKSLRLVCEPAPGPLLWADDGRLVQLVDNLVSNAIKYTPDGGRVDVRAEPSGSGWQLQVADSGIGIPAEEQGRLFDKFYRASNARERQISGSGLGLSIAQSIAALHGGRITVESSPSGGSTFTVTLVGLGERGERRADLPG